MRPKDPDQPLSVSEILSEISRNERDPVPSNKPEPPAPTEGPVKDEIQRYLDFAKLIAFQSHHYGKRNWSYFMMFVLAGLILFQALLLYNVGTGQWDFTRYQWLLPVLLVQNLAQVIGLAQIVVKSLFDSFKE